MSSRLGVVRLSLGSFQCRQECPLLWRLQRLHQQAGVLLPGPGLQHVVPGGTDAGGQGLLGILNPRGQGTHYDGRRPPEGASIELGRVNPERGKFRPELCQDADVFGRPLSGRSYLII